MTLPDHCPHCGASFQGDPVQEKDRKYFGDITHFSRLIGYFNLYTDRTEQYICPDCRYVVWDITNEKKE